MMLDQRRERRSLAQAVRADSKSAAVQCRAFVRRAAVACCLVVAACATTKPVEQAAIEPYTPIFSYPIPEPKAQLKKTIGVIAPIDRQSVTTANDPTYKAMRGALKDGTANLIHSKGYRIIGNYDSRDSFGFQEKKLARLIIHQEMDLQSVFKFERQEQDQISGKNFATAMIPVVGVFLASRNLQKEGRCVSTVAQFGAVAIYVQESITGEMMATKRIEIPGKVETFTRQDATCDGHSQEALNAWARLNEATYKSVMAALDKMITDEEITQWDDSAQEIRKNTKYSGGGK